MPARRWYLLSLRSFYLDARGLGCLAFAELDAVRLIVRVFRLLLVSQRRQAQPTTYLALTPRIMPMAPRTRSDKFGR